MTVAAVFTFPKEELERYDRDLELHGDVLRNQPARRFHVCFETQDNYTVVDVWDSLEAFEKFGDVVAELAETTAGRELNAHASPLWVELHKVHNLIEGAQK
jgi:heme-degrading monooxygenase HmoA